MLDGGIFRTCCHDPVVTDTPVCHRSLVYPIDNPNPPFSISNILSQTPSSMPNMICHPLEPVGLIHPDQVVEGIAGIPNHYTVQPFREQYIQVIVAAVIVDEYKTKVKTRRRRRQLNLGITAAVIIYKKCLGAAQRTCTDVADEFTATTHPPNTA